MLLLATTSGAVLISLLWVSAGALRLHKTTLWMAMDAFSGRCALLLCHQGGFLRVVDANYLVGFYVQRVASQSCSAGCPLYCGAMSRWFGRTRGSV